MHRVIIEPTSWSAICDYFPCDSAWDPDMESYSTEEDVAEQMRDEGWITLGFVVFCSLDCLLMYRGRREARRHLSKWAEDHGRHRHRGQYCCHGFHNHQSVVGHMWACPQHYAAYRAWCLLGTGGTE